MGQIRTSDIKLKFCPKCGSEKLELSSDGKIKVFGAGILETFGPRLLKCQNCGYESRLFPMAKDKKELLKIQENYKRKLK
jgi:DNA-directed RNA polymerase subunit M/transcription elongation factor TFIIS